MSERNGTSVADPATGDERQVDVLVTYDVGDREMRRIVEVENRKRKTGSEAVDEAQGKRMALQAARATLVSTSGFTGPALDRVRADPHHLDAVWLRPASPNEWPASLTLRSVAIQVPGLLREVVSLEGRVYEDANTNTPKFFVAFGHGKYQALEGAVLFVVRIDGLPRRRGGPFGAYSWISILLPNGTRVVPQLAVEQRAPDGTTTTVHLGAGRINQRPGSRSGR